MHRHYPRHAAIVLLFALCACGGPVGSASISSSPPTTASPSATPTVSHIPVAEGEPGPIPDGSIEVDLDGETNGVTACAGSIWVQVHTGHDTIFQIDPASGDVIGQVDDGTNLACHGGEPWAATGTEIQHIDAATGEVIATVAVNAFYVGSGAGSVWAPSGHDVIRIDPDSAEIVATIEVDPTFDLTEAEGSDDAIWVTAKEADKVYRIDPITNTVVAEIPAGAFAHGILVQPDALWISNAHEDTVTRIDPATNAALFVDGPGAGVGLAEGAGYVWASSRGVLFRIDPATSQAVALVEIGGWPYGIAYTDGVLWVGNGITSLFGIPVEAFVP